ncbi:enoyl-CoA hydratase [Bosea sp. OK403]|uniref:crotonase/enoyl-CoA hydratase family protein n=1 Tax=Bosea sp. OK403 TaxID=1855286 RepID=UPI0008F16BC8|nr:crotonase/enoyl-CoA hydratase family protein [Bosea sp. OK403]SFI33294.1 enoyl-CoA hydratase [Bosea sp. OK403]
MTIRIERAGKVATVIHSRPEARNAMDPESAEALTKAFLELDAEPSVSAIVFWGEGGAFCAGWDLKYAQAFTDAARFQAEIVEGLAFSADGSTSPRGPMGPSRLEMSKPLIAAIEGPAVAGGMELALWCDVRVMAENAYFGVYCRRWGIPLIDGGTVRLPRLVGQGRALEIIMTGRKVEAQEALRIGLCEQIAPRGQARAVAEAMAQQIARFPQGAMLADRRSAIAGYGLPVREALAREWGGGVATIATEGAAGAGRFASGKGRGGDFGDI